MKSWKTTTLGIIGGLSLLLPQIVAVLDDDPNTQFSLEETLFAFAVMGVGVQARDNNVSSEKAGAK